MKGVRLRAWKVSFNLLAFRLLTLAHSLSVKHKFNSCEHSVSIPAGFLVTGANSFSPAVVSCLSILEKKGKKKNG